MKLSGAALVILILAFMRLEQPLVNYPLVNYPLVAAPSAAKWIDLVLVSEESYCIFDGEKYGYLSENGREIAPCIYDIAYPFSEGLACVCLDGKYGYIDTAGETVIPFVYDRAAPFMEGLAYFVKGDKYGFMDKTGEQVFYFECDSVSSFQEGLAFFSIDGRYGYIDQIGQVTIEPVYDDAGYFRNGLAKVMKDGRYGVINREGAFVVAADYDYIDNDGTCIIARNNGVYSCFDKAGKVLVEQAGNIYHQTYGNYIYFTKDGKEGLIDETGKILAEPLYEWISLKNVAGEDFLIVDDGLYGIGVMDLQGEVKIPAVYHTVSFDEYLNPSEGGKFVLIDADGNTEYADVNDYSGRISYDYDSFNWLSEDRAVVSRDGLSGMIDRKGNIIMPIEYDAMRVFADGAIWLKKGGKSWFYNSNGEAVTDIGSYDDVFQNSGSCYQTVKDGKYGFLDEQGKEALPPVYDSIMYYDVFGSDNVYVLTNYNNDIKNSIIKTGEPVRTDIISGALLQNEITPRIGLYQEFARSGSISVEDATPDGHTASQEDLRDYKKTYKLYDFDHSGEPVLYFKAQPYQYNNFPLSYSGFYAVLDNRLVELLTGYECGGSLRGDYICLWYDRETSRILPGTNGMTGGFGGYAYYGAVYKWKDKKMTRSASFGSLTQPIAYFSNEELEHAEMVYDGEDKPYTKERIAQAGDEEIVQTYSTNGAQVTIEEYQEMRERYQMIWVAE